MTSNPTNDNMKPSDEDDNGNRATVADLRRKFDEKTPKTLKISQPKEIEESSFKIAENRFKKQDTKVKKSGRVSDTTASIKDSLDSKLDVNDTTVVTNGVRGTQEDGECGELRKTTRVNNFASFIPAKDYQNLEILNGDTEQGDESSTDLIGKRFTVS